MTIKISCGQDAAQAAEALERLTIAAEKATAALAELQNMSHGGISIKLVGDLCQVDIERPEFVECQSLCSSEPTKMRVR